MVSYVKWDLYELHGNKVHFINRLFGKYCTTANPFTIMQ